MVKRKSADGMKEWEDEAEIDLSDDAFELDAFRTPKPFRVRFVCRSEERRRVVEGNWDEAKKEGYVLRGMRVDVDGVVRPE